jgi:predicted glycosyltransferase
MKNQLLLISAVCLGLLSVNAFADGHGNHDEIMIDKDKMMMTTMETHMLPTIVENAVATESVSTLVAAVQAA